MFLDKTVECTVYSLTSGDSVSNIISVLAVSLFSIPLLCKHMIVFRSVQKNSAKQGLVYDRNYVDGYDRLRGQCFFCPS